MQILLTAFVVSLFALTSCAVVDNSGKEEINLVKFSTITTHDAVNLVESNIRESDSNELDIYAPDHFRAASKALEEAKQLLIESQPRDKVVQKVAVAEAVLRNGDLVMRKIRNILVEEIKVKNNLDSINTQSTYEVEYGSLNERFNKIIRQIESGDESTRDNREQLLKDMKQLERKALHFNAMNEPREILKRVKYSGGEKLAPLTYNEAMTVFKRAEDFITKNPNFESAIIKMGREALFAAKRAFYVTEAVSSLKQKVNFAPEQVILDEEYRLYRVARQLADFDYRDSSLEVQSELLAKGAKSIAVELKNKDELVIALRDTLIKVRDSSSRLTLLSESTVRLKSEKNRWLAKEALFKAKVDQLALELKESELQLDTTQQKLLTFKNNNTQLNQKISANDKNTTELKNKLAVLELSQEDDAKKRNDSELQANKEIALLTNQANQLQAARESELQASKDIAVQAAQRAELEATESAALLAKLKAELESIKENALLSSNEATLLANKTAASLAEKEALIETNKTNSQQENVKAEDELNKIKALLAAKEAELLTANNTILQANTNTKLQTNALENQLAEKDRELQKIIADTFQLNTTADVKAKESATLLKNRDAELNASNEAIIKANQEIADLRATISQQSKTIKSALKVEQAQVQSAVVAKINEPASAQQVVKKKERAKITEKETLEALESVKELISSLEEKGNSLSSKTEINVVQNNTSDDFLDEDENDFIDTDDSDDIFVDASE